MKPIRRVSSRAVKKRTDTDRRAFLKRLGLAAGGVAASGYLQGCDDAGEAPLDGAAPDGGLPEGGLPDGGTRDGALDAGPDALDGGPDGNPDLGPSGPVDLEPLRGDGSHPFHYIEHLVIVQFENRTFDHYFGSLSLLEGRDDIDGLREGMANPAPNGDPVAINRLVDHWVTDPDPPHGHRSSVLQFNGGANDGFVRAYAERTRDPEELARVMGYYAREDLPASYGLADAFTLCQRWHCALLGPTWPNRFFSHCATSAGQTGNDTPIDAPTPYPALAEAGFSYRTYFHNLYFTALIRSLPLNAKNAVKTDRFFEDAAAGTLPNVSIVEPPFFLADDHPPADVRMGQAFLASIYEAVRQSPCWPRTLMVVFYDEHGGFFDHVPPPESRGDELGGEAFGRLGFRVPALMVGPLVRRGHVLDTVVEHSSVPALISNVFGLPHVNERSRLAGDLGEALSLDLVVGQNRPLPPALPPVEVPIGALEYALRADNGQPELLSWMRRMGFAHHDSLPERRRVMRRTLDFARRLGAVRFR